MAGLLKLNTSIFFINFYLYIYLISKNYNTINILQIAKNSYFQFKKGSRLKYINNTLKIYIYSTILLKNYQVDCIGLRKLILGLKGECEQDLFKIYHTNWGDGVVVEMHYQEV